MPFQACRPRVFDDPDAGAYSVQRVEVAHEQMFA